MRPQHRPSDRNERDADHRPIRHPSAKFCVSGVVISHAKRFELTDLLIESRKLSHSRHEKSDTAVAAMATISIARSIDRGDITTLFSVARGDRTIPMSRCSALRVTVVHLQVERRAQLKLRTTSCAL